MGGVDVAFAPAAGVFAEVHVGAVLVLDDILGGFEAVVGVAGGGGGGGLFRGEEGGED